MRESSGIGWAIAAADADLVGEQRDEVVRHASSTRPGRRRGSSRATRRTPAQASRALQHTLWTATRKRDPDRGMATYLLDNGLRKCLAHGDAVSKCNSAATTATSGVVEGGVVGGIGQKGRQRTMSVEIFAAAVLDW